MGSEDVDGCSISFRWRGSDGKACNAWDGVNDLSKEPYTFPSHHHYMSEADALNVPVGPFSTCRKGGETGHR